MARSADMMSSIKLKGQFFSQVRLGDIHLQRLGVSLGGNLAAVVHLVVARLVLPLRWLRHKQPAVDGCTSTSGSTTDFLQELSALHLG